MTVTEIDAATSQRVHEESLNYAYDHDKIENLLVISPRISSNFQSQLVVTIPEICDNIFVYGNKIVLDTKHKVS